MVVSFRLLPLIAALAVTSCSMPLWLAPSQQATVPPPYVTATARLSFSLPHASARGLSLYQVTVEPENLIQAIDHFTVILTSVSGAQTISRSVSKAEAASVAFEGLVAAADWSLEVRAWADLAEGTMVGHFYADTGLSTVAGSLTNLGDLTVAPVAGTGTSPFRVEIADLPSGLTASSTDFDLSELAADGTATPVDPAVKAAVILTKTQNLVVVQTTGTGIATGTYRLVVKLKDSQGQLAAFSPLFVINLFPNLTSSKTFSAADWSQAPASGTIAPAAPLAAWSALVLAWTTDSPYLFSGYDWVWHPGTAGADLPTAAGFDPSFVSPLSRSGFLTPSGGSVPLSRPQWTLPTGSQYTSDLAASPNWTLYVRGAAPGSKTGWIAISVNLQTLVYPLKVSGFQVISTEMAGTHTLVRTLIDPTAPGIQPTTVPVLSAQSFSAGHTGDPSAVTLGAAWYLSPNDQLTMVDPLGQYRSVKIVGRPSGPGQTVGFVVYQGVKDGNPGYWAFDQAELATLGDDRTTDWTVDPRVDNGASSYTPRGRVITTKPNITGRPYGSLIVAGYQFKARSGAPLALEETELGFLTQAEAQDINFAGAILNTPALNTSADVRHFVARVRYTLDDGAAVYGPWSNTAADTFWGQLFPDLTVDQTNRFLVADSNWRLDLSGTWKDAQGDAPGLHPLQYRFKQAGDYDYSSWDDIAVVGPTAGVYTWNFSQNFVSGAQGEIQFRVSSSADGFVESDPLDFAGASAPAANLMSSGLNNSIGKVTYLAADRQNDGWFAQGFTGNGNNVFLSHWLTGGGHDSSWGTSGSVITPWGVYFPKGIGFVQTSGTASNSAYPTGYRLWVNGFQPSHGRNHFSSYTYDGTQDTPDLLMDWDHGLGRPVIDSVGNIAYLGWYGNDNFAGSHWNKLWVDKIDSSGTATGFHWEVPDTVGNSRDDAGTLLGTLAVDANDKILVAGGKRVVRINTDGSTDITFGTSGWATVDLGDLDTTTDIRALKVGAGGKIYLLVGPYLENASIIANLIAAHAESTLIRLNSDGSVDNSWGGMDYRHRAGTVVLPSLFLLAYAIDLDASGNIVVVGKTTTGKPYVGRILADGSGPDATFGGTSANNGFVLLNDGFGGAAESVAITSGGSIGIGGWVKYSTNDDDATPALWKF